MPKFKIGRGYGFAGADETDIVECDTLKDAQEWAHDWAMERIDSWAAPLDETEQEE